MFRCLIALVAALSAVALARPLGLQKKNERVQNKTVIQCRKDANCLASPSSEKASSGSTKTGARQ
jgi:hypothetical protein